jgi:DNA primase
MVYDGDLAGELATLRSLEIFIEEEMSVRVAPLPAGYDPDTYVRKFGIDSLNKLVSEAENLFDYQLKVLKRKYDFKDSEGKARIASVMLSTIKKLKDAILRDEYIRKLAEKLDVDESFVRDVYNNLKAESGVIDIVTESFSKLAKINPTEKLLMKLMLEETELVAQIKDRVDPADFQDKMISKIVKTMFELSTEGKNCSAGNLLNHLGAVDLTHIVCESTFMPEVSGNEKEKVIDDCIMRLKKNKKLINRKKLQEAIKHAEISGNEEELNKLKNEFNLLIKQG